MKNYFLTLVCIFLFVIKGSPQDVSSRLFFYGGFQTTSYRIFLSDMKENNVFSKRASDPRIELGYEFYFNNRSGLVFKCGYSSLSQNFIYNVDSETNDTLSAEGLKWNNFIRLPNNQQFINFQIGYVYHHLFKERNKISLIFSSNFRYGIYSETRRSSNLFYETETDYYSALGPKSYQSYINYKRLSINPNFCIRYERITKYNNSYGIALDFNLPLSKNYEGYIDILPEFENLTSRFNFYSRGGFISLTCFYGIGFGKSN